MDHPQRGFTLIELMIVVAITGVLAAIALPAYQDFTVRSKISEAVLAAGSMKVLMSEAFHGGNTAGLDAAAKAMNSKPQAEKRSKYVQDVLITEGAPWDIKVFVAATTGNGIPTGENGHTIVFTPNVNQNVPKPDSQGAIDWACASAGTVIATTRGFKSVVTGTLAAKFAPAECR